MSRTKQGSKENLGPSEDLEEIYKSCFPCSIGMRLWKPKESGRAAVFLDAFQ